MMETISEGAAVRRAARVGRGDRRADGAARLRDRGAGAAELVLATRWPACATTTSSASSTTRTRAPTGCASRSPSCRRTCASCRTADPARPWPASRRPTRRRPSACCWGRCRPPARASSVTVTDPMRKLERRGPARRRRGAARRRGRGDPLRRRAGEHRRPHSAARPARLSVDGTPLATPYRCRPSATPRPSTPPSTSPVAWPRRSARPVASSPCRTQTRGDHRDARVADAEIRQAPHADRRP